MSVHSLYARTQEKGKVLVQVVFRLAVWYTRLRKWHAYTEIKKAERAKDGFLLCLCENLRIFPLSLCFLCFAIRETVKDGPNDFEVCFWLMYACLFPVAVCMPCIIVTTTGFGADTPQQDRGCVATNAPVGRLSGSPVLRQQDGGAWPRTRATSKTRERCRSAVPMAENSKIENLYMWDDSCSLCFPSTFLARYVFHRHS